MPPVGAARRLRNGQSDAASSRRSAGRRRRRRAAAKRRSTAAVVAARCCAISSIESPPNFSRKASARTKDTIASPTTAAAGTAHTSLRSIAAGAFCSVVRSTDRSGCISVAMGFMKPGHTDVLAVGHAAFETAGVVRWARQRAFVPRGGQDLVVHPRPRPERDIGSDADADRLDGVDAHHRLREAAIELCDPTARRSPRPGGRPLAMTSKAPPSVSPASLAASIAAIIRLLEALVHAAER